MAKILDLSGTAPEDGQTLGYDAATLKWRPVDPPDSGTSGSGILNVSGTVNLTDTPGIREVYATASATVEGVALTAGDAAVFRYLAGAWTYMIVGTHTTWQAVTGGGGGEDTTPPVAGTLTASNVQARSATVTVTGASDAGGLHSSPYAFSINGAAWTAWQSSNVYQVTGLSPSTLAQVGHKVRDAAGNESTGTAISFTTLAALTYYQDAVAASNPAVWFRNEGGTHAQTFLPVNSGSLSVTTTAGTALPRAYKGPEEIWGPGAYSMSSYFSDPTASFTFGNPAGLDSLTGFTIEALLQTTNSAGTGRTIAARSNATGQESWLFWFNSTNRVELNMWIGGTMRAVTDPTTRAASVALHAAATWDGTTLRMYVNGVETASTAAAGAFTNATTVHQVGMRGTTAPFGIFSPAPFMDELAIYTTALSPAAIAAHHAARSTT